MTSETGDVSFEAQLARTRTQEANFLGLSLAEAEKLADRLGLELRVIDSASTALRSDLRSRRVTVDVRSGSVTTATAG